MVSPRFNSAKTIVITGSSSGIGLATARHFLDKGWQVVATMRDPDDAPSWMADSRVLVLRVDVTDLASLENGVAAAIARFGAIDVMFANAGYGLNGPLEGASEAQMLRQYDVNVFGVARTIQAVAPHMRERGGGTILVTSSIGGRIGMPAAPFYISSKHAVEGLIESARFELQPFGVRLKLIEPGGIRTDFSARSAAWTHHPAYADAIAATRRMAVDLLENMPEPAEVAKVVYAAANDRSSRLRYAAKPGPYLLLYRLLPDRVWRGMIEAALHRAARQTDKSARQATAAPA
ncbi:SDR family oxidoreductase [Erythrobacter sp. NE805]|uniref:SDR family oxidoreductase n=1 Tax=Erythrobacter sp. NE805 TaxID=3389875 RepID=UPI00396B359B